MTRVQAESWLLFETKGPELPGQYTYHGIYGICATGNLL